QAEEPPAAHPIGAYEWTNLIHSPPQDVIDSDGLGVERNETASSTEIALLIILIGKRWIFNLQLEFELWYERWRHCGRTLYSKSYTKTCTCCAQIVSSTICSTLDPSPPASPQPIRGMWTLAERRKASPDNEARQCLRASYRIGGPAFVARRPRCA